MKRSAKVKKVTTDAAFTEGVREESFVEWIVSKFDNMFIDNLPLDTIKELPPRYMYFTGSIVHITTIACLLYFIYTGYDTATTVQFVSVNDDDGICSEISRQNSGSFLATNDGYWEGNERYAPSNAIYQLDYYSYATTMTEYRKLIRDFKAEMKDLGRRATRQDATYNIMNWITWQKADTKYRFQLTGDSIDVFNR